MTLDQLESGTPRTTNGIDPFEADPHTNRQAGEGPGEGHAPAVTYVDTALAALCNAFSYAQSMAYQQEVLNQQRWETLMQAAFSRTAARIATGNPEEVKEQLSLLNDALKVFQSANSDSTQGLAQMTQDFKEATQLLMAVKSGLE